MKISGTRTARSNDISKDEQGAVKLGHGEVRKNTGKTALSRSAS